MQIASIGIDLGKTLAVSSCLLRKLPTQRTCPSGPTQGEKSRLLPLVSSTVSSVFAKLSMKSWLVHHWIGLSGGGLAYCQFSVCRFFGVRRLVLKGDSWTFEYRRRKHPENVD